MIGYGWRSAFCRAVSPWRKDRVLGCCGNGGLGGDEELAADQPAYGRLRGTLGDADGFGEILITDGDGRVAALLLAGKPEVDEKARRAAIVADEVAQENVGDIRVEFEHGYTDR